MKKRLLSVMTSGILGFLAYIRVKEKRSYQSYLREKFIRMSGMKKTFENVDDAKKALEATKDITAGKYGGTSYEFEHDVRIKDWHGSLTYILNDKRDRQQKIVLYVHGGAWFQDPLEEHFQFIDKLAGELNAKIVMPVYPKVPHRDYRTTFQLLKELYEKQLMLVDSASQITIMGDSAGGQITLSFAQHIKETTQLQQPGHLVLVSPVLDATFSNPEAKEYEKIDPMLGIDGSKYFIELWAGNLPIEDYKISPINGDLEGLGRISIFIGTKETLYPDAVKLSKMLSEKGIDHDFTPGYNLFHIYPVFPLPEQQKFFEQLKKIIK
ncbi:alpha/beta hydrolase fold domain-containing protein [Staphylococcus petrasii]|uniref:alpha/beta hydrolase fold domain-containing protein n=1 Tax=Staphylococcus petrasii TaxID=1276936 RepID=UPI001F597DF9|nr:alpha/beta hydrolase [Staphylococcus petrasii]MCI2774358.1 alpha/beta hydrolase [Staphylococcus petrasii]